MILESETFPAFRIILGSTILTIYFPISRIHSETNNLSDYTIRNMVWILASEQMVFLKRKKKGCMRNSGKNNSPYSHYRLDCNQKKTLPSRYFTSKSKHILIEKNSKITHLAA